MDTVLIVANVLSFIANSMFTISTLLKSKRKILLFQSGNHALAIVSESITKAYTGLVQEAVCLFRNILFVFVKIKSKLAKNIISLILMIFAAVLGIILNIKLSDNVWYGYIPVFCGLEYSIAVMIVFTINISDVKAELVLKICLLINSIGWSYYGFKIELYPIFGFNILNGIFCIVSIIRCIIWIKNPKHEIIEETKEEEEEA